MNSQQKSIEIQGYEKWSFERFLGSQQSKIVGLDKVLGIGGEGVVIEKELEIEVRKGTYNHDKRTVDNIRLKSKEKKIVALKFVKFEKDDEEKIEGQGFIIQAHFITIIFDHKVKNKLYAQAVGMAVARP